MNTALSFLVTIEPAGPALEPLLWRLREELQPGDQLVFVCDCRAGGRNLATMIRLFEEVEGFGPQVGVEIVELVVPGGVRFETLLELGYAALRGAEAPVLTLDAGSQLDAGGLNPLRAARAEREAATGADEIFELVATESDPYMLPRLMISPALLRDPARPRADGPGGTVALARHLLASASRMSRITVPDALTARQAEPSASAARALATLAVEGAASREVVEKLLPALWRRATPGGRAVMSPILFRASLAPPATPATLPAPSRLGRTPLRVWRGGPHAHRMPLAYPALRPLWEGRIDLVGDPAAADVVAIAHPLDALSLPLAAARAVERGASALLLSEEPFWDSLFSPDPLAARISIPAEHLGEMRLHQLNHHRSAIFDFQKIPYLLLTEHRFASIYAARFKRNAKMTAGDWAEAWTTRSREIAFMAERRIEAFHDMTLSEAGLIGLCAWRSRLAVACDGTGVERLGASWTGGRTRFELSDWHLDKLTRLDGQTRLLSALENTHQALYLSEKLFDAFACGAVPVYMAAPGHAVERLGLPEEAWVNLWSVGEDAAPGLLREVLAAGIDWRAYAQAQRILADLFDRVSLVVVERDRLRQSLIAELEAVAE